MFEYLGKNLGVVFSGLVMFGTWLVMFGSLRATIMNMKETQDQHKKKHEENDQRWTDHIQDETPHKSCLMELRDRESTMAQISELRHAISRVEGWVMAMAAKQGVKSPFGNGD